MLDPANESVKRIFKCNNRNELLNKYFKLLDEYFLHNFIFMKKIKTPNVYMVSLFILKSN